MLLNCGVGEDCNEIKPVHSNGNQSWIFIGRTNAEAEAPILWPPMQRTESLRKTLMPGKIEGRRTRGWQRMRWLVASPTQRMWVWASSGGWWWSLVCCSPWDCRVAHSWVTELETIHFHLWVYFSPSLCLLEYLSTPKTTDTPMMRTVIFLSGCSWASSD